MCVCVCELCTCVRVSTWARVCTHVYTFQGVSFACICVCVQSLRVLHTRVWWCVHVCAPVWGLGFWLLYKSPGRAISLLPWGLCRPGGGSRHEGYRCTGEAWFQHSLAHYGTEVTQGGGLYSPDLLQEAPRAFFPVEEAGDGLDPCLRPLLGFLSDWLWCAPCSLPTQHACRVDRAPEALGSPHRASEALVSSQPPALMSVGTSLPI